MRREKERERRKGRREYTEIMISRTLCRRFAGLPPDTRTEKACEKRKQQRQIVVNNISTERNKTKHRTKQTTGMKEVRKGQARG